MDDTLPFVSVVVPTYNRADLLRDCLKSLLALDYPRDRYEIIVVDDGSRNDNRAVLRCLEERRAPLRYVYQDHRGANAARNRGITLAREELICFVDDEVVAPQDWLRAVVDGYQRWPDAGCYGGPVKARLEGPTPRHCDQESLEGELDLGNEERPVQLIWGGNMALASTALQRVGSFNEMLSAWGEEVEWEQRHLASGGRVIYLPGAWLWHRRTADDLRFSRLARKWFRRGRGEAIYFRVCGEPLTLWTELCSIPTVLAHAVLHRCTWGVLAAARHLGRIWGILRA